ncbi:protein of unknown function [Desulfovibrio sp. 86]|nr:protein of unknown function [Desulfovibrio sp. 86]
MQKNSHVSFFTMLRRDTQNITKPSKKVRIFVLLHQPLGLITPKVTCNGGIFSPQVTKNCRS